MHYNEIYLCRIIYSIFSKLPSQFLILEAQWFLFLFSDTPSTLRILPLVRPSTIQITSRGRVVFIVTTTLGTASLGQLDKFNDVDASPCHDITAHLAPEFLSTIDKKVAFAESDIEKVSSRLSCVEWHLQRVGARMNGRLVRPDR